MACPARATRACLGTLLWLAEEGYIRFDSTIGYDALDQATLSEKGFLRLSRGLPHAHAPRASLCHPACAACKPPSPINCVKPSAANTKRARGAPHSPTVYQHALNGSDTV